jgi:hypothetical protein
VRLRVRRYLLVGGPQGGPYASIIGGGGGRMTWNIQHAGLMLKKVGEPQGGPELNQGGPWPTR